MLYHFFHDESYSGSILHDGLFWATHYLKDVVCKHEMTSHGWIGLDPKSLNHMIASTVSSSLWWLIELYIPHELYLFLKFPISNIIVFIVSHFSHLAPKSVIFQKAVGDRLFAYLMNYCLHTTSIWVVLYQSRLIPVMVVVVRNTRIFWSQLILLLYFSKTLARSTLESF